MSAIVSVFDWFQSLWHSQTPDSVIQQDFINEKRLIVGFGNGHNKPSLVYLARNFFDHNGDAFATSEAQRLHSGLKDIRGTQFFTGGPSREKGEVTVSIAAGHKASAHYELLSHAVPGHDKYAPERNAVVAHFGHMVAEKAGATGIGLVACHLNATNRLPAVAPFYAKSAERLVEIGKQIKSNGELLIIGGDMNRGEASRDKHSPIWVAGQLGLKHFTTGPDWLMYDPRLKIVKVRTPKLYDHHAIIASLENR